ncbi:MAG: DUF3488 domain-containing protein [Phycisphaeraceae bacterium]|nr:DUF3488 domain-containing protein [Phycisphaeraceae bacterium]
MNIGGKLNTAMCWTVAVGVLAFAVADGAVFLMLLGVAGPAVAYLAGRPDPARPDSGPWALPRWVVSALVFLAIASALASATVMRDGTPLVSNLGAFLTYVQLIKLSDRRTTRDESQLLGLSVFTAIAAVLTSNSLAVGVLLAAYTPLAVTTAMRMEVASGRDLGAGVTVMTGRALWADLRRAVGASVVCAGLLAAAVFLAAPRGVGNDWLGTFGAVPRAEVGFTDNIRLGQQGNLNERPTPVFEVTVTDGDGRNIGDPSRPLYFRGATRDTYDRRGIWINSSEANRVSKPADVGDRVLLDAPGPRPSLVFQTVQMRARIRGGDDYVFALWRPTSVTFQHPVQVATLRSDLTIKQSESSQRWSGRRSYAVESALTDTDSIDDDRGRAGGDFATGPIADLARRVLAERLTPGAAEPDPADPLRGAEPRQAASILRDFLRTNYAYTLQMTLPREGQDPIEMFLFDTRRGHCEYFASAMVAMCQSVGIPARIVAGYVATEFNAMTGQYTVRESNAHAWAEVRIGPGRWLTMDPSPPGDIERIHAPSRGVLARLKSWYDLIEFNWNEAVVTFDSSRQTRLFRPYDEQSGSLQQAMERARKAVRRAGRNLGLISGDDAVSLAGRLAWWGAVAFVLGGIVYLARKRLGAAARWRSGNAALDEEMRGLLVAARFYPRALRRIERAGLGKPRGRSGPAHAAVLRRRVPEIGEPLGTLAGMYERVRFGRERLSDSDVERAAAELQRLEAAVRLRRHGRASKSAPPA